MTQKEELKQMLEKKEWTCGNEFLQAYLPEYRSIINKIKQDGFEIEQRRCENTGHHHKGGMQEWKIKGSVISNLPRIQTFTKVKEFCCIEDWRGGNHNLKCFKLKIKV